MPKPTSPRPEHFSSLKECDYWHMAQDTAFRAGAALVLEEGTTWLVFGEDRQLVITAEQPDHVWFETWRALHLEYAGLSRLWLDGRALKP